MTRYFSLLQHLDWLGGQPRLLFNGFRGLFPGGKAAGPWTWPLTSTAKVKHEWIYTSPPVFLFGVHRNRSKVSRVPSHHGMMRRWDPVAGGGYKIWEVAENIWSFGRPTMGDPLASGLSVGLTTSPYKNNSLDRVWTWTNSWKRPTQRTRNIRFGTLNVMSH